MKQKVVSSIRAAAEAGNAKAEKRLPENAITARKPFQMSQEIIDSTSLAYMMSDAIYTIMSDLCIELGKMGKDLRHETKHRFNRFFDASKQMKRTAQAISSEACSIEAHKFDSFVENSDLLRDACRDVYYICTHANDGEAQIRALLQSLRDNIGNK